MSSEQRSRGSRLSFRHQGKWYGCCCCLFVCLFVCCCCCLLMAGFCVGPYSRGSATEAATRFQHITGRGYTQEGGAGLHFTVNPCIPPFRTNPCSDSVHAHLSCGTHLLTQVAELTRKWAGKWTDIRRIVEVSSPGQKIFVT